jgi:hypothetical protein
VFGVLPRLLAAVASSGGAVVVIGGAVWIAVRDRRRAGANALIAAGTVVLGAGGLLNSLVGEMNAFAISLLAGVALLFAGFLAAGARSARRAAPGEAASPPTPAVASRRN